MSIVTGPVAAPYSAAWCTRYETFALQISFLLGRQLTLGHEPPIQRRSTTAVAWPDEARCHARSLPPAPLPRITFANDSACGMPFSFPGRSLHDLEGRIFHDQCAMRRRGWRSRDVLLQQIHR